MPKSGKKEVKARRGQEKKKPRIKNKKILVLIIVLIVVFLINIILLISLTKKYVVISEFANVTRVIDGDTLVLNNSEKVRLSGINAAELGECFSEEAKEKLEQLVIHKEIGLEKDISDRDKYNRLLRYIYVKDNRIFVNGILVQEGYVKVYDKYAYDTKRYKQLKKLEENAMENKIGVWQCQNSTTN